MMRTVAGCVALALLVSLASCGGADLTPRGASDCLTDADVSNLPAGDATGTAISGTYVSTAGISQLCRECNQNQVSDVCSSLDPKVEAGQEILVTQTDGVLTIAGSEATYTGGVNADGTFVVGGSRPAVDDQGKTVGTVLARYEGSISGDTITIASKVRLTATVAGVVVDTEFSGTITYERK